MSFYGNKADAKKFAEEADIQIDGLNPADTSPVQNGGSLAEAGGAPLEEGPREFSHDRTRMRFIGNQGNMRREFPAEGVTRGKK